MRWPLVFAEVWQTLVQFTLPLESTSCGSRPVRRATFAPAALRWPRPASAPRRSKPQDINRSVRLQLDRRGYVGRLHGLAFMSEEQAAPHLANGALVRVLEDWCPPFFPGFFLYYPSRRQHPAALGALIETLRL